MILLRFALWNTCFVCLFFFVVVFFFFWGGGEGGYLTYFGVITLGHIRVFKGKSFTMLFIYFLRSFNKWGCAFKNIIFLFL